MTNLMQHIKDNYEVKNGQYEAENGEVLYVPALWTEDGTHYFRDSSGETVVILEAGLEAMVNAFGMGVKPE